MDLRAGARVGGGWAEVLVVGCHEVFPVVDEVVEDRLALRHLMREAFVVVRDPYVDLIVDPSPRPCHQTTVAGVPSSFQDQAAVRDTLVLHELLGALEAARHAGDTPHQGPANHTAITAHTRTAPLQQKHRLEVQLDQAANRDPSSRLRIGRVVPARIGRAMIAKPRRTTRKGPAWHERRHVSGR
jgi:hypothetical protein